jgi:hypothetical protein
MVLLEQKVINFFNSVNPNKLINRIKYKNKTDISAYKKYHFTFSDHFQQLLEYKVRLRKKKAETLFTVISVTPFKEKGKYRLACKYGVISRLFNRDEFEIETNARIDKNDEMFFNKTIYLRTLLTSRKKRVKLLRVNSSAR